LLSRVWKEGVRLAELPFIAGAVQPQDLAGSVFLLSCLLLARGGSGYFRYSVVANRNGATSWLRTWSHGVFWWLRTWSHEIGFWWLHYWSHDGSWSGFSWLG
jgi:hypothetical protein